MIAKNILSMYKKKQLFIAAKNTSSNNKHNTYCDNHNKEATNYSLMTDELRH